MARQRVPLVPLVAAMFALAACGPEDECAGLVSGACAAPITLRVDVEGAIASAVSGSAIEALSCSSSAGQTQCVSLPSLTPGTYAYDITAEGRSVRVSIVVGPDPGGCFSCGFDPATESVTLRGDGGA